MSVKEPTGDLKKACWKGYTAIGMKKKNGRKVPNCVPVSEEECPVRSQHGHKRVNQAFRLDEETGRNATPAEHKKTLDTLLKRPDLLRTLRSLKKRDRNDIYNTEKEKQFKDSLATKLRERSEQMREEHADKLKGTPVVSLSDFTSLDYTKNRGKTVPKKLKKDDPRVKFHKDTIKEAAQGHTIEAQGIRGMKGTAWRKTFKSYAHLAKWADANDSVEVHGTRDLEQTKKGNVSPAIKEVKDEKEYDYEGDMAKSQLRSIIANAQTVHDMLEDNTNLAEWVQSKITLSADYISTVRDYMQSNNDVNEEVE